MALYRCTNGCGGGGDTGDKIELNISATDYGKSNSSYLIFDKDVIPGYCVTAFKLNSASNLSTFSCGISDNNNQYVAQGKAVLNTVYQTTGHNGDVRFHVGSYGGYSLTLYLEKY